MDGGWEWRRQQWLQRGQGAGGWERAIDSDRPAAAPAAITESTKSDAGAVLVTEVGADTATNELQSTNAPNLMLMTEVGIDTVTNELHQAKARSSMLVTVVGIDTFTNELHPRKAHSPMLVTDSGMVTLLTVVTSTSHSSHEPPRRQSNQKVVVPIGMLK